MAPVNILGLPSYRTAAATAAAGAAAARRRSSLLLSKHRRNFRSGDAAAERMDRDRA
jgi:hypothetical protein